MEAGFNMGFNQHNAPNGGNFQIAFTVNSLESSLLPLRTGPAGSALLSGHGVRYQWWLILQYIHYQCFTTGTSLRLGQRSARRNHDNHESGRNTAYNSDKYQCFDSSAVI